MAKDGRRCTEGTSATADRQSDLGERGRVMSKGRVVAGRVCVTLGLRCSPHNPALATSCVVKNKRSGRAGKPTFSEPSMDPSREGMTPS